MLDYIIIGQGLGGSVLAWTLIKRGNNILVVDKGENFCSKVAGGLYNPVTGRRMVKTWKANTLFPFLEKFYRDAENKLNQKFFYSKSVYKPFSSVEEQNQWMASGESEQDFVKVHLKFPQMDTYIQNDFGGFETRNSGYLEVAKFLESITKFLIENKSYIKDEFLLKDLDFKEGAVSWKGVKSKRIIFCEGFLMKENSFFNWLPFSPVKGETLTVVIENFPETHIVNKDVFILPLGNGKFKAGATFDYDLNLDRTEKGREELSLKLKKLLKVPFKIIDQEAGIRPASKDRRPLVGIHPEYSALGVFNGLGTKGVSLAPFFAEQFVEFLDGGGELDPDINIQRYYSLYYGLNKNFQN
jgi:glycine/D-amino acid oxidase-like deaminating enzyme